MDAQQLFLSNLEVIDAIIAVLSRRHNLDPDTADDMAGWIREKLIADDYAVLRRYEGRSSLRTYLTVVLANLYRDYNNHRWGRWRPSAEARRLGEDVVLLETLLRRDGLSLHEAILRLRQRGTTLSDRQLAEMAMRLPVRSRPRAVSDETLSGLPAPGSAEDDLLRHDADAEWERQQAALQSALGSIAAEDRIILRMRYWDGLSVADIARTLSLDQKPLYRRIERLLVALRGPLETLGVDGAAVARHLEVES